MLLSKLLSEEGGILSKNWYYSTELRVVNLQLIWSFLFRFFDNWFAVRLLGTAAALLLMSFCVWFLCRESGVGYLGGYAAAAFLTPITSLHFDFIQFGIFYITHICFSFVLLGFLCRYVGAAERKKAVVSLFAGLLFSFAAALNGLRQLLISNIPALLAAICFVAKEKDFSAGNRAVTYSALSFLGALGGYFVNNTVFRKHYIFVHYEDIYFREFSPERAWRVVNDWMSQYGYKPNGKLFSSDLISNFLFAVLALSLVISAYKLICKKNRSPQQKIVAWYYISAMAVLILLYGFSDMEYVNRYILPVTVFGFFLPILMSEAGENRWESSAAAVLSCCIVLQGCLFYSQFSGSQISVRDTRVFSEERKNGRIVTQRDVLCRTLLEKGYSQGIASFWNSNVLTEISNGEIEIWAVRSVDTANPSASIFEWLQNTAHSSSMPDGRFFFLFGPDEEPESYPHPEMLRCADEQISVGEYNAFCFSSMEKFLNSAVYHLNFADSPWLNDGFAEEEKAILRPHGLSFGPYWSIPAGDYALSIYGDHLDRGAYSVVTDGGQSEIPLRRMKINANEVQLEFSLELETQLEFYIRNTDNEEELSLRTLELSHRGGETQ